MAVDNKKNALISFALNHSRTCIILTVLIALASAYLSLNIEKNTTPYFLGKQHAERVKEDALSNSFLRTKETIVVVLERSGKHTEDAPKTQNVFEAEAVKLLQTIHDKAHQLDLIDLYLKLHPNKSVATDTKTGRPHVTEDLKNTLVDQYNRSLQSSDSGDEKQTLNRLIGQYIFPVKSVKSLLNSDDIYMEEDDIVVAPNFSIEKLEQWKAGTGKEVLDNPLFLNSIINEEASSLAVHIELSVDPDDSEATAAIFTKIQNIVETAISGTQYQALYSGSPVVNVEISNIMEKDNQTYFPLIIALITLILSYLYRNIWAPLLALAVSVLTILITFGLMSLLGITLNIVTTILPIFIITIGVTDAIHVLSSKEEEDIPPKAQLKNKVSVLFRAMMLTSLTTALGFFSLSYTEIGNIKDFGIMVGIGTLIAFVISVTTLPALIKCFKYRIRSTKSHITLFSVLEDKASRMNTKQFYLLLCVLFGFSMGGLPQFYVDQQNLASFQDDTNIRQDDVIINQLMGGTVPVSVWIKTDQERGILDSEVLKGIEQIQAKAVEHGIVGYSVSIVDFLKQINKNLFPENGEQKVSQFSSELIAQYLFLLEGGPSRDLETIAKVGAYNETRVVIMCKTDGSRAIQSLLDDITLITQQFPDDVSFEFAGYGSMNAVAAKEIVHGQLYSIIISVLGLLALLTLIYKSLKLGLIALFPLTMSLLVMFGLMGYARIPLDIGSSLLCGVAFGIGIDYSIHIIESFKRAFNQFSCIDIALKEALHEVSFPILTSAFTIALGFSILMLSDFKPIFNLGLLISITMLVSALCALFIVPRLLQIVHKHAS